MGRIALVIAACALLVAPMVYGVARPTLPGPAVTICVDGRRVGTDAVTGATLTGFVLDGEPMLPVRLFDHETLGGGLDLHLLPWRIVSIASFRPTKQPFGGALDFKAGESMAYGAAPMVGGSVSMQVPLPVAPVIVNGRFYVPADPTLEDLGYDARWEAGRRTLRIGTRKR